VCQVGRAHNISVNHLRKLWASISANFVHKNLRTHHLGVGPDIISESAHCANERPYTKGMLAEFLRTQRGEDL
jgi:hypothetical protein